MTENGAEQTKRLFVALPVPASAQRLLTALPPPPGAARAVLPADLHITLRFLGDVTPDRVGAVIDALTAVRKKPFHIEIDGLDRFAHKDQSVLYARVASTRNMLDLCARITDRLVPLGFDFGTRPLVPHVTLARLSSDRGLPDYIKKHSRSVTCRWLATGFALMESGGAGASGAGRYHICRDYPLSP